MQLLLVLCEDTILGQAKPTRALPRAPVSSLSLCDSEATSICLKKFTDPTMQV